MIIRKIFDKIFAQKLSPNDKSVVWLDTFNENVPILKVFLNNKWKSVGDGSEAAEQAARAAVTANQAAALANTKSAEVDTKLTTVDEKIATIDDAVSQANSAVVSAQQAITAADNATTAANTANSKATSALNQATTVVESASNIIPTAQRAAASASSAATKANNAATNANNAAGACRTATASANQAATRANNAAQNAEEATSDVEEATEAANQATSAAVQATTDIRNIERKLLHEGDEVMSAPEMTRATDILNRAEAAASSVEGLNAKIGDLSTLNTEDKSNLTKAINEVNVNVTTVGTVAGQMITQLQYDLGDKEELATTAKNNLVAAINEVDGQLNNCIPNSDNEGGIGVRNDYIWLSTNNGGTGVTIDGADQSIKAAELLKLKGGETNMTLDNYGACLELGTTKVTLDEDNIYLEGSEVQYNGVEIATVNYVEGKTGDLTNLATTNKSNIVAAINEVAGNVGDFQSELADLQEDMADIVGGETELEVEIITGAILNTSGNLTALAGYKYARLSLEGLSGKTIHVTTTTRNQYVSLWSLGASEFIAGHNDPVIAKGTTCNNSQEADIDLSQYPNATYLYIGCYSASTTATASTVMPNRIEELERKVGDGGRTIVNIKKTDTEVEIYIKMRQAFLDGNADVFFEKADYNFSSLYVYLRDVVHADTTTYGLHVGNGCRYYFNGSTLKATKPEGFATRFNLLDTKWTGGNLEMYDGTLICENGLYCVHDEAASSTKAYLHKYENMVMQFITTEGTISGAKPFGCGTGYNSTIEIQGCSFISNNADDALAVHGPSARVSGDTARFSMRMINCYTNKGISFNRTYFNVDADDNEFYYCNNTHAYAPANTDVFDRVVMKDNNVDAQLGEISTEITTLQTAQGNLSDLATTDKSSLVAAINEAAQSGGGGGGSFSLGRAIAPIVGATYNAQSGLYEMGLLTDLTETDILYTFKWASSVGVLCNASVAGAARGSMYDNVRCLTYFSSTTTCSLNYSFLSCNKLEQLVCNGITVNNMSNSFRGCAKLKYVYPNAIDLPSCTDFTRAFETCGLLEYVKLKSLKASVSFPNSPNLRADCIAYMINKANATASVVITLHATAYARAMADAEVTEALAAHTNVSLASA